VGGRLDVLTERRPKPALPFGGTYRLIDFALSNCAHSGLTDVWVVEQYLPHPLNAHLANGRPWDLDRLHGGLRILPPYQTRGEDDADGSGFAEGNADALWRNREPIREFGPDLLLVLSADQVYRMDYRDVVERHLANPEAAVTMATVRVPKEEAVRFGNVTAGADGRVTGFAYKPERPDTDIATAEVFVYDAPRLLDALDRLAADKGDGPLKDFGHELIPHFVAEGAAWEFRHDGYWRDVGTIESYFEAHRELLTPEPPLLPDDPAWPVLTFSPSLTPARIVKGAEVEDSLVSKGDHIAGRVARSVLGTGVVVEAGATVEDAVLLGRVVVRAGAAVRRAIVDEDAEIGACASVGAAPGAGDAPITLVGTGAKIAPSARVTAGERVPPGNGP
jgi:glucose-1-phosphate adenylyltransferase